MLPDHRVHRFWRVHPFRMTAGMLVLGGGALSLLSCLCAFLG
jgi:hypothetical protein